MSISLSTLTNPATSDSVLLEAQSEADFLEPIVLFKNRATGSNAISNDPTQTTANDQPLSLPLIDGDGYLYMSGVNGNYAQLDEAVLPNNTNFDVSIDFYYGGPVSLDYDPLFSQYNISDPNRFFIYIRNNGTLGIFWANFADSTLVVTKGRHTVRFVKSGSTITVYLDGVQGNSLTHSTDIAQTQTTIGDNPGLVQAFKGAIFRVTEANSLFNVDFTATSIADGASSFDCSTGQTVTINTGSGVDQARIVRRPKAVFNNSQMDFVHTNVGDAFFVCATESGVVSGVVDTELTRNNLGGNGLTHPDYRTDFLQTLFGIWPNTISDSKKQALVDYAKTKSTVKNWAGVGNFVNFLRGVNLKSLDASYWDTASATTFAAFCRGSNRIESLDIRGWDTSSVVSMNNFARGCTSLVTIAIDGNTFSDSACTDYTVAFKDTNLNQATIDDILVRINAAGTSNGTFGRTGGEYPSTTGVAAKNALQARGWSMTFSSEVLPSVLDLEPAAAYSLRALKSSEDPNVVRVRRSSDGALSNFKASEVSDGTLTSWVNTEYEILSPTLNNGGFEGGLTGWSTGGAVLDTSVAYAGSNSARFDIVSGGYKELTVPNSLQIGTQYKVTFWAKVSDSSATFRADFGSGNLNPVNFSSTDWEYKEVTGVASGSTSFRFARDGGSPVADFTVNFDNVTLTQLTADGHVTTWYDQGGTNDADQTLVSNMPKLVDGGTLVTEGGKPALDFPTELSNLSLDHSDLYGQATLDSYYVTNATGGAYLYPSLLSAANAYGIVGQTLSSYTKLFENYGSPDFYANGSQITGTMRDDIYTATSGGQKLVAHLGADTTNSLWGTEGMNFGNFVDNTTYSYTGKLQEMVFFNTDQSANRTAIETNINSHFTIYS